MKGVLGGRISFIKIVTVKMRKNNKSKSKYYFKYSI